MQSQFKGTLLSIRTNVIASINSPLRPVVLMPTLSTAYEPIRLIGIDLVSDGSNEGSPSKKKKTSVSRTESHQARFNSARAMFEKMGSADDLLDESTKNVSRQNVSLPTRASSVGRNYERRPSDIGNKFTPMTSSLTGGVGSASTGSVRSRSISPYGSVTAGTPSSRESPSSELNNREAFNGHVNVQDNGIVKPTNGSINGSVPPSVDSDDTESLGKSVSESSTPGRPNIKAVTNKQRNWFSSFEKGKSAENVDSSRRTSVKNDNTPSFLSGGGSESTTPTKPVLDVTPTPPANLNLPGDRRPLSAKASSDSIDDYLKNWKKTGGSPTKANSNDGSNENETSFSG